MPPSLINGLTNYWRFDGNSKNSFGGLDGSYETNISYNSSYGKFNQGVRLDVDDSQIQFEPSTTLISGTNDFTLSFWIKKLQTGDGGDIISRTNPGAYCWELIYYQPTDSIMLLINNTVQIFQTTKISLDTNWHLLVITRSGSTWTLYDNGNSVSTSISSVSINTGSIMTLGKDVGSLSFSIHMYIDEIGIWNRAITPSEVTNLYNGGNGLSYPYSINTFLLNFI